MKETVLFVIAFYGWVNGLIPYGNYDYDGFGKESGVICICWHYYIISLFFKACNVI